MPTGPEYLQSAHELEKKADDEQLIGQAHLDIARAQLHATYALIETVEEKDGILTGSGKDGILTDSKKDDTVPDTEKASKA